MVHKTSKIVKFKAWMRYNPPTALTGPEWKSFNKEFRTVAPIRYWLQNSGRRKYVLPIKWKWEGITDWIRLRTTCRYHVLLTGLPPGYSDHGDRILHSSFNLLKDYVECEQGYSEEPLNFWQRYMPFYYVVFPYRDPAVGVKHLEWASTLDDPTLPPHEQCIHQAISAREILILYKWWIETRPARKEFVIRRYEKPSKMDKDTLDDFLYDPAGRSAADYDEYIYDMEKREKQAEKWEKEDTNMLVRLMKVRKSLW